MTAEIVIMNRFGVALAADSAVTVGEHDNQQIYNSANKLFTLSKYHPVGIMIYQASTFMGIPWEAIIKVFRKELGRKEHNTLEEYCKRFFTFITENQTFFSKKHQENHFIFTSSPYLWMINKKIQSDIDKHLGEKSKITAQQIKEIVDKVIKENFNRFKEKKLLPKISENDVDEILRTYSRSLRSLRKEIFENLPMSRTSIRYINKICAYVVCRDWVNYSGIVIAGYGEKEVFPSLYSYAIYSKIGDKLLYHQLNHYQVGYNRPSVISPFAQSDEVLSFLTGVDPNYDKASESYLSELFTKLPDKLSKQLKGLDSKTIVMLNEKLSSLGEKLLKEYRDSMFSFQVKKLTKPVLESVEYLPKDELAIMAESLVNLTSFKKRISYGEKETVGGPIDVALISKGDGFIWIKRKHYFDPQYNFHFFSTYFNEEQKRISMGTKK